MKVIKNLLLLGTIIMLLLIAIVPNISASVVTKELNAKINNLNVLPLPPKPITPFMPYDNEDEPLHPNRLYTFRTQINFGPEYPEGYTFLLEWDSDGDHTADYTSGDENGDFLVYDGLSGLMQADHAWGYKEQSAIYLVSVRVIDEEGELGDWSEPLKISTPRTRLLYTRFSDLLIESPLLERLFSSVFLIF